MPGYRESEIDSQPMPNTTTLYTKPLESGPDIEDRMRVLNAKLDRVTSKTKAMVNRSWHLNDDSKMLRDQVVALQKGVYSMNRNLDAKRN